MPIIRLRNELGDRNVYYEFNSDDQPLGEGGMGRVFRGRRIDKAHGTKRDVAIKMMFDDLPDHVIERARREASIRIMNDNLVEMIDFVEVNERNAYGQVTATHYHVVSEFLDGVNLDEFLKGQVTNHDGSPNPTAQRLLEEYRNNRPKFVGFVFRNILSGIIALHYKGYIHRDIDPSNIMVTSDGKIKLIDFGIAREVDSLAANERHLTNTGQFIGKSFYAASELVLGDLAHQDYRTDIYALGIMLFQLMTGHLPFDGPMHDVCDKQLHEKLPLDEVNDKNIRKIIAKATEKKQEKRYQTAAEMLADIDKWMMGKVNTTVKPAKPVKQPKPAKPHDGMKVPIAKIIGIAAGVALLVGLAAVLLKSWGEGEKTVVAEKPPVQVPAPKPTVTETPKTVEAPKPIVINTVALAERLMMDKNTASYGLTMLNDLVDEGDYNAMFLYSRLLFNPNGNANDRKFYEDKWATMRTNAGLTANNGQAHRMLFRAYLANENDFRVLYELGCDFMSGQRGCERNAGNAKWCFDKASALLGFEKEVDKDQYRKEIDSKLERLKNVNGVKPK